MILTRSRWLAAFQAKLAANETVFQLDERDEDSPSRCFRLMRNFMLWERRTDRLLMTRSEVYFGWHRFRHTPLFYSLFDKRYCCG